MFKPLVIPKKLQQALPYRDKPNHGIKSTDKKTNIDRVAVIKEPHEQKVGLTAIHYSLHHHRNEPCYLY